MITTNRFFLLAALATASAFAQQAPVWTPACPYTLASLRGTYSVVITYGANVGMGFQTEVFDGNGNITRTGVINQPANAAGDRSITTTSAAGTYTVNCNGTGTVTKTVLRADGTVAGTTTDDFIITTSVKNPGQPPIATALTDAQRSPSVILTGGVFLTRVHTRLPDINPAGN